MKKVESYLNSLQPKEVMYIFVSIPIVVFIFYYNFAYPTMTEKVKKLEKAEKKQTKQLVDMSKRIRTLKLSSKQLLPTKRKLQTLKEDFKYLKYSLHTLKIVSLNDTRTYNILSNLLNKSNEFNLNTSFDIKWDNKYPPFTQVLTININGQGNYLNIIKYLQYIENMNNINYIQNIKIYSEKNNNILMQNFVNKNKFNDNSLSFVLQKYSNKDLDFLKSLSKSKGLNLNISVYEKNTNYLSIYFKGNSIQIQNLYKLFKRLRKNKSLIFSNLNIKLHKIQSYKDSTKTQKFSINLIIVGIK